MSTKLKPTEIFRQNLETILRDRKITQIALANHINAKPQRINDYLSDRINFSEKVRVQIADYFGFSYTEFLNYNSEANLKSWYFTLALSYVGKKDWFNKTHKLSKLAAISKKEFDQIIDRKIVPTNKTQIELAKVCGFDLEAFIEIGKKEESKLLEKISGTFKEQQAPSPTPIDPSIEIIQEVLKESKKEFTPEKAQRVAKVLKQILDDEAPENVTPIVQEHQDLVKGFRNHKKGLKANHLLIKLEKLNKREFYKHIADLEGFVEDLEQEIKSQEDSENGSQAASGE
jgi:plasmid maintenance system antidote protein VapI